MPIYEYYCAGCGSEFEAIRPVSRADDPIDCKTCQQPATRQISNFSFKSDTFTAPKLRRRPGDAFRGGRHEAESSSEPQDVDTSAG
jgi:putative FmdB family regulatory protein